MLIIKTKNYVLRKLLLGNESDMVVPLDNTAYMDIRNTIWYSRTAKKEGKSSWYIAAAVCFRGNHKRRISVEEEDTWKRIANTKSSVNANGVIRIDTQLPAINWEHEA